jgi:hypothetical protein
VSPNAPYGGGVFYQPQTGFGLLGLLEIHAGPGTNLLRAHDDDDPRPGNFTITASSIMGTVLKPDGQPVNIRIN